MDTIIVKPEDASQWKEVMDFLKKVKVKKEVYKEPSNAQVLKSVEQGAKEAAAFLKGEKKLREAKDLLGEL